MYLGRVVESGTVDEVLGAPLHPYTRGLLAAIPVPEPGRRRRHTQLAGETPDAATVGPGCAFQDRCPNVMSECRVAPIPTIRIGARKVACLLYGGPGGMVQSHRDGAPVTEGDSEPAVASGGAAATIPGQGGT
jgi:oligopeptide/dipeptide ABC transporter ATP-binding protein